MTTRYDDLIRRHTKPLLPLPTSQAADIRPIAGIQAVMFDIYGTLLISASGDFDSDQAIRQGESFAAAVRECGVDIPIDGKRGVQQLSDAIERDHERRRQAGTRYPEVDIVSLWQQVMTALLSDRVAEAGADVADSGRPSLADVDCHAIALAYELRVNPVWPMPHASRCLHALSQRGLTLGLISNAQRLTIDLWQQLLRSENGEFQIDRDLQIYSYQHGCAKPGGRLYQIAVEALSRRGVKPESVLYVGNDMLKDILPAQKVGFHTALFAGDLRSLRKREDDPRVDGVVPDVVITNLYDILSCIA